MGFNCGLVGLPNVGKSTIFNALTSASAAVAAYAFTTVEPNVGIVGVPDARLAELVAIAGQKKATPATMEVVDIAGLIKGASKGEGLGNQFLSHIRAVDAILEVVRCFEDANIPHAAQTLDPEEDVGTIEMELILSDMEIVEKRIEKDRKVAKSGDRRAGERIDAAEKARAWLDSGKPLRACALDSKELAVLHGFDLITLKPVLFVANIDESGLLEDDDRISKVRQAATERGAGFIKLCGKLEAEIVELALEERKDFLAAMGLEEPGLARLARAGYQLLNLESFFTIVGAEVRAWAIQAGSSALKAAGKIHTDMQRGFIKAEVIGFDALKAIGTLAAARDKGLVRIEGKEYIVKDGDVITFRFNV